MVPSMISLPKDSIPESEVSSSDGNLSGSMSSPMQSELFLSLQTVSNR